MKHILFCSNCNIYTMKDKCYKCGGETLSKKPPKYSPLDKYARFRREVKSQERKGAGLI